MVSNKPNQKPKNMKKVILLIAIALLSFNTQAQNSTWFKPAKSKWVCAAYNYGQFSGPNGTQHKYRPWGQKRVKGRNRASMHKFAAKRFHGHRRRY